MTGVETLRAQVRWLANAIAASMVLMFLAVALPWVLRMIEADLASLAWTLTAFAAAHAVLLVASERVRAHAVMLRLLYAVPLFGVAFMALLWHHGGGVAHPSLAVMMVLPVIAAAGLPRAGFALDVALYSVFVTATIVTIASPDFSWYLTQLGVPGAGLGRLVSEELLARDPFPGATTTPAAAFLFVVTFGVIQLATAVVAARVAGFIRGRQELAVRLGEPEADTLAAVALRSTPASALTVIAATGQIVQVTNQFVQQMVLHNKPLVGHELTSFLHFHDQREVRAVLAEGGSIARCAYRVGREERTATLIATTFEHEGTRYASILIHDWDEEERAEESA